MSRGPARVGAARRIGITSRAARAAIALAVASAGLAGLLATSQLPASAVGANNPVMAVSTNLDGTHGFNSVSCVPGGTFCLAVDASSGYSTYSGTWNTLATTVSETGSFEAVSCPAAAFCVAVDSGGHYLTATACGATCTWSTASAIAGDTNPITSVSCPTVSFCAAVDGSGNAFTAACTATCTWTASPYNPNAAGVFVAVSCSSASFCLAVTTAGNSLTYNVVGGVGTWTRLQLTTGVTSFVALSCTPSASSTSTYCVGITGAATAGADYYTGTGSNGGWAAGPTAITGETNTVTSVSCPTPTYCLLVDRAGDDAFFNGSAWSTPVAVDVPGGVSNTLESVSCATTVMCALVDGVGAGPYTRGDALVWNGTTWLNPATWASPNPVDGPNSLQVSCPTAGAGTFCMAVDNKAAGGQYLTYNGAVWSASAATGDIHPLTAVSCVNSTFCMAVDSVGGAIAYNGADWTTLTKWANPIDGAGAPLNSVSCTSTTFCMAVDNLGNSLVYNGTSWASITSVSCVSPTFCVEVDSSGAAYEYNGTNWTTATTWTNPIDAGRILESVSCVSTTFCVAVDSVGDQVTCSTGPPCTWAAAAAIDAAGAPLKSVSCVSTTFCVAVDSVGDQVTCSTGPPCTWAAAAAIDAGNILESVSCVSTTFCVAVDSVGDQVTCSTGPPCTWAAAAAIDAAGAPLKSVSCVSTTFCVAVDSVGDQVTCSTGPPCTWAAAAAIDAAGAPLKSVSCVSTTFCVAVDSVGDQVTCSGGPPCTWAAAAAIDGAGKPMTAVSCVSTTFCVAVDSAGYQLTCSGGPPCVWAPSGPMAATATGDPNPLKSVSCVSTIFCVAVDSLGDGLVDKSGVWTETATIDAAGTPPLNSVACPSSAFCVAADSAGKYVTCTSTINCAAGTWTAAVIAVTGDTHPLESVSCVSATFCVTVDSLGNALMFQGAAATSPWVESTTVVDGGTPPPTGVSCASTSLCMMVDGAGNAFELGQVPNAPTGVTAVSGAGSGTATVGWTAPTANATPFSSPEYVLTVENQATGATFNCLSASVDCPAGSASAVSWTTTSAGLTGLSPGVAYYFYIASLNGVGVSSEGASSVLTPAGGTAANISLVNASSTCSQTKPAQATLTPVPGAPPTGFGATGSFADMGPFYVCLEDGSYNSVTATSNVSVSFLPFQLGGFNYVSGTIFTSSPYGPPVTGVTIAAGSTFAGPVYVGTTQAVDIQVWGNVPNQGFTCGFSGYSCNFAYADFAGGTAVGGPSASITPTAASATAAYTFTFTATGGIVAGSSGGVIELDASAGAVGTVFPSSSTDYVVTDLTNSAGSGKVTVSPQPYNSGATVAVAVPNLITAGDQVQLAVSGVTNPTATGSTDFTDIATSTDGLEVPTTNYAIGPSETMTIIAGSNQSTALGQPFGSVLEVKVSDPSGNPLPNVSVTFTAPTSGASGTFSGSGSSTEVDQSNSQGDVFSSTFNANMIAGTYSVQATSLGLPTQTFSLHNGSNGAISSVNSAVIASPASVAADGQSFSIITVTLENASKVPVQGKTVSLVASSGTASIVTTVVAVTNASGQATFHVTDIKAETVAYTATDTTDSSTVNEQATVFFTAAPVLTITPAILTFAQQAVGSKSPSQSVTFDNTGTEALTVFSVVVSGADPQDFTIAGANCGTQLAPGQSCSIFVVFAPVGTGPRSASLKLLDNAASSPQVVNAAGAGIPGTTPVGSGYWLVASNGAVYNYGAAGGFGSASNIPLAAPIVGMAPTANQGGYWLLGGDGGIFSFGDAAFYGSTGAMHLNQPVVAMAATGDGKGYWLVASDGGIFSFGDAVFYGSVPGVLPPGAQLNEPVVAMAATPDGRGYWMVASDGGIFTFGDASFYGSLGGTGGAGARVVDMAPAPDGKGYWILDAAGDVYTFALSSVDAAFYGSAAVPAVAMAATPDGKGYWIADSVGEIVTFGDAGFGGDASKIALPAPIVGVVSTST